MDGLHTQFQFWWCKCCSLLRLISWFCRGWCPFRRSLAYISWRLVLCDRMWSCKSIHWQLTWYIWVLTGVGAHGLSTAAVTYISSIHHCKFYWLWWRLMDSVVISCLWSSRNYSPPSVCRNCKKWHKERSSCQRKEGEQGSCGAVGCRRSEYCATTICIICDICWAWNLCSTLYRTSTSIR